MKIEIHKNNIQTAFVLNMMKKKNLNLKDDAEILIVIVCSTINIVNPVVLIYPI